MTFSRRRSNRKNFDKDNLDKRVDQFIEVGRQFVDGVSGARPGKRKVTNLQRFSRNNIGNVGKWVSEKVDSLLEDDFIEWEDEDLLEEDNQFKSFSRDNKNLERLNDQDKRPLQAISLRESNNIISDQKRLIPASEELNEEWPADSDFKINKWQRSVPKENESAKQYSNVIGIKGRNLPRSSRRRI